MKILTRLLDDLETQMNRTAQKADVDAVHDLRVSVRRASQALRVFNDQLAHARRLRKELSAIRDKAAPVRDRDVTMKILRRHRLPLTDPASAYLTGQRDFAAAELQLFLSKRLGKEPRKKWAEWLETAS